MPAYDRNMDLEVDRTDLRRTRLTPGRPVPDEPSTGSVLFRIDNFGLTANNVTYAVVGDLMGYWRFFPTSGDSWGRVPVWGFAEVEASSHGDVADGERYFGYWPMSSHVLLEPVGVGPQGFTDGAAHRADLSPIYNRYQRAARDDADAEARRSILQPLFGTSFLLDDWLGSEEMFGADAVVVSSASSKTALGLAHLLSRREQARVIGITSSGHVDFVRSTGTYDEVIGYGDLPAGLGDGTAVLVDLAGDRAVLHAVHGHFGSALRRSVQVGFTHHDVPTDAEGLPGPQPELFFAPDHAQRRSAEWGAATFAERLETARAGFDQGPGASIAIDRKKGVDEVMAAWLDAVDGRADPSTAVVCSW